MVAILSMERPSLSSTEHLLSVRPEDIVILLHLQLLRGCFKKKLETCYILMGVLGPDAKQLPVARRGTVHLVLVKQNKTKQNKKQNKNQYLQIQG
jgi:hypothetical protein